MSFEKLAAEWVAKTQNQNRLTLKSMFADCVYDEVNEKFFKKSDELAVQILRNSNACNDPTDFSCLNLASIVESKPTTSSDSNIPRPSEVPVKLEIKLENTQPNKIGSRNSSPTHSHNNSRQELFAPITEEEFKEIPKYMKGSINFYEIDIILKKIEVVMLENFSMRHTPMSKLSPKQKDMLITIRDEIAGLKLTDKDYYCSEAALINALDMKLRTKVRNAKQCLRHIHRTKDTQWKGKPYIIPLYSI